MDVSERIVKALLDDVTDRRGWRQEWDQFDDDVQEEIRCTWLAIVRNALAGQDE